MIERRYRLTQQAPQEPSVPIAKIQEALKNSVPLTEDDITRLLRVEKFARLVLRWPNSGRFKTHLRTLLGEDING